VSETPNLRLPYILPAQAQKHVTHNEALRQLDALVQLSVLDHDRVEPPIAPADGDRHVVAGGATGLWSGRDGQIAAFQDGAWSFYEPEAGWRTWSISAGAQLVMTGDGWVDLIGSRSAYQNLDLLGVNATADSSNRLSVHSDGTLLNHEGAGHRLNINKATTGDTASLVFQQGFGGRAEIGLAGDDELQIKVSSDGEVWVDALRVAGTGRAVFPASSFAEGALMNLFQDGGRFAGTPEAIGLSVTSFGAPGWLSAYNGAAFAAAGKFTNDNSTNGGSGAALPEPVSSLIDRLKGPGAPRRYGPEFYLLQVTAGSGTLAPRVSGGVTRYLPFTTRSSVLPASVSCGIHIKVDSGSVAVVPTPGSVDLFVDGAIAATDMVLTPSDGWKQPVFVSTGDSSSASDYNTTLIRLYAAPGSAFLMGLAFLTPVQLRPIPGEIFGRVPSLQPWR
jgi:hypothetical protein